MLSLRIMSRICVKCNLEKPDSEFNHRAAQCRNCVNERNKSYKQSERGKEMEKLNREKNKVKFRAKVNERKKRDADSLTDEYVISQLVSKNSKEGYTREYLKNNPELIEIRRIKILNNRLKRKIEDVADKGTCSKCKKVVPLSFFRYRKPTKKKRGYLERICKDCVIKYNKAYWQKTKNKKL